MASVFTTHAGSPPQPASVTQLFDSLDSAAEQLMVLKDFASALQTCSSALEKLRLVEEEDSQVSELKAGFCIVGIQALAEMNQWPGVLSWLLQHYEGPESLPARVLQMCIVLYTKVGDAGVMLEAAGAWLHCESNRRVAGFGTVAELYLLHVLLPLGLVDQARQLVLGQVGSAVFSEEQRLAALDVVEARETQIREPSPGPGPGSDSDAALSPRGAAPHWLEALLKATYRKLLLSSSGSLLVHRLVLAALLLYMLFLRLDPALPSSFLWISKLLHFLRHMWSHVRSLHSPSQSKGL
ncbi:peroxisome assembly protein 26 isoform X2 [Synchiropus splendidus]|uniref:peroxisome assembly protein 26 isoform X2 n=1 Tax=Synchiropus splendidus TaxID=270530 RepID=UPI00237E3DE2|nr:peroxisome assembly protein 26 isoform X2 [Synchiropus splendidus]